MEKSTDESFLFQKVSRSKPAVKIEFGEVWEVKNSSWTSHDSLENLSNVGWHPGLCIRASATIMAFGTTKYKRAIKNNSSIFLTKVELIKGKACNSGFILDYALPLTYSDIVWWKEPYKLQKHERERLINFLKERKHCETT